MKVKTHSGPHLKLFIIGIWVFLVTATGFSLSPIIDFPFESETQTEWFLDHSVESEDSFFDLISVPDGIENFHSTVSDVQISIVLHELSESVQTNFSCNYRIHLNLKSLLIRRVSLPNKRTSKNNHLFS